MPRKPIDFSLDFMIKDIFPRFTVKQFDDVSFNIKPLNQGLDYDTTNMTGKIFVGVNNDMFMQTTGITVSSDNINVLLDRNMLQKQGRAYAEIELTDEAGTITSSSFIFDIDPKIGEGGQIPGEYEGFVVKYERLIAEFRAQINTAADSCYSSTSNAVSSMNTTVANKMSYVDTTLASTLNTFTTNANSTINNCNTSVASKLSTVDGLITAKISSFDTQANAKLTDVENRFQRLTATQQQASEVIDARQGQASLLANLNRIETKATETFETITSNYISATNTNIGYAQNVEIYGNTYQDPVVLSDIRSVGTQIAGQTAYEIPLLCTSSNILDDKTKIIGKYYAESGGFIEDSTSVAYSHYVPVSNNEVLSFNYDRVIILIEYNSEKEVIKRVSLNSNKYTVPNGVRYVRLSLFRRGVETNLCVTRGNTPINFEPYQEDKLTILSPVQLEKVNTSVDRIVKLVDVWNVEKNIGKTIYTGLESWVLHDSTTYANTIWFKLTATLSKATSKFICNKFNNVTAFGDTEGIFRDTTYIYIGISKTKCTDLATFKTWLGLNNTTVMYEAITPTYYVLPNDQQVILRTFANKTNILSLCEIEPTFKLDVPKSIGATVNTHTTQIDSLNSELDRVKKLEESTTSTVVTETDFTVVDSTTNGYFEDVKLEGKTLVNYYDVVIPTSTTGTITQNGNIYRITRGTGTTAMRFALQKKDLIIGKNLTMIVKNYNYSGSVPSYIRIYNITTGENISPSLTVVPSQQFNFTIPSTWSSSDDVRILVYANGTDNVDWVEISNEIILINQTSIQPSYFTGLSSVGDGTDEIVVSSVSPNLIIKGNCTASTGLNTTTGATTTDATTYVSEYVRVQPSTAYIKGTTGAYCFYDINKTFISGVATGTTFTTPSTAKYVRCVIANASIDTAILVRGTILPTFTEGKQDKKRLLYYDTVSKTWLKPTLRGIGTTVRDSVSKSSDNKYYYYQNCGLATYKGTETWTLNDSTYSTVLWFATPRNLSKASSSVICDKFKNVLAKGDYEGIFIDATNVYIGILKTKCTDLATFKTWLTSNNVNFVFELNTKFVYECTNIDLICYSDETNYIVTSGAIAPTTTLKVQNNLANVLNITREKVSLLEDRFTDLFKLVLAGNMQSLAYSLYPEDFPNDNEEVVEEVPPVE